MTDNDIDDLTKTVKVSARAQPEDKLQIVKSPQRQGLVACRIHKMGNMLLESLDRFLTSSASSKLLENELDSLDTL